MVLVGAIIGLFLAYCAVLATYARKVAVATPSAAEPMT